MAVETDKDGNISHVNRSEVVGTLEENITELRKWISTATSEAKGKHLHALLSVAEYLISNGPVVSTIDA